MRCAPILALPWALALPGAPWRLACVVRVGNSSADIHGFHAVRQSWGSQCDWLVAVIGFEAREELRSAAEGVGSFQVISLQEDPPTRARDLLQLTLQSVEDLSAGKANLACSFNRLPGGASLGCGRRLYCEASSEPSAALRPLQVPMCGARVEDACEKNYTRPVAIHAPSRGEIATLHAVIYHGWPHRCALSAFGRAVVKPRVAVLIGSLLRGVHKSGQLLQKLFVERRVRFWIFIYSAPPLVWGNNAGCAKLLDDLSRQLPGRVQFRYATRRENLEEELFESTVNSRHMRQWYKLQKAYEMMAAFEEEVGKNFDLVLKLRTDMFLPGPIDLAQFPEVWTSRVIYGFTDIAFLCRRDVAHSLLANVTGKLTQFAGNQRTLVFLDYRRLLRNGWGDGFRLQTFPDASPALKRAVFAGEGRAVLAAVRRHLTALEAAHQDAARGLPVATFSGHWRFRPDTVEFQAWQRDGKLAPDTQMCSVTRWFYLIHRTTPEVRLRPWPSKPGTVGLFPSRFAWHCNCEPPGCWPLLWGAAPRELVRSVEWLQRPEDGQWVTASSFTAHVEPANDSELEKVP
ncbi:unnamed protein product, partial [Effrenium voratum]